MFTMIFVLASNGYFVLLYKKVWLLFYVRCNSLPRKKQRVKFEDDASPPERPPPPVDENKPPAEQPTPPARNQQPINQQNAQSPNQTNSQSINQTNAQPVYNAPQPPARQQSINTMKNLSPITSAYNNALIETTKVT